MARGQLLLQRHRLSGAASGDPLPSRARREAGVSPYTQRLGIGPAANADRRARELPAAGWHGHRPAFPPSLHGRDGADHAVSDGPDTLSVRVELVGRAAVQAGTRALTLELPTGATA